MGRLPPIEPATYTPPQQALHDALVAGPRMAGGRAVSNADGTLVGPFNAWIHDPVVGARWSALGEELRFRTRMERRLFELAVVIVAAHARAAHEWSVHQPLAEAAGISASVISALAEARTPSFAQADEACVYAFVSALLEIGTVGQLAWSEAAEQLGLPTVVELVSVVGYYLALALALNAFDVSPSGPAQVPWLREGQ